MNFSEWDQYTFRHQETLLADIASTVKNRVMPPPQYKLVHRDARLSDADTDVLYAWARVQRRRVKSQVADCPRQQPMMSNLSVYIEINEKIFAMGIFSRVDRYCSMKHKHQPC